MGYTQGTPAPLASLIMVIDSLGRISAVKALVSTSVIVRIGYYSHRVVK